MRLPWRPTFLALLLAFAGLASGPVDAQAGYTYVWPTKGRITQQFGCTGFSWEPRRGSCAHFHSGIDIANKAGTPIRASTSGVVQLVGYNPYDRPGDRAWVVVIKHDAGFTGWYAHMQAKYVKGVRAGSRVNSGQLIGYMGNTGRSTGVHLHFAFLKSGVPVNPSKYLPPWRSSSTTTSSRTTSIRTAPRKPAGTGATQPKAPDRTEAAIVAAAPPRLPVDYAWYVHDQDYGYISYALFFAPLRAHRPLGAPTRF